MFREKYFDATVKDNEFTAVIDQEGTKRKFEGTIGKDGEVSIWGMWDSFHAAYRNRSGIYPMSIGGQFSGFSFIGTFEADLQWGAHCRGTVYLVRAPLTLVELARQERAKLYGLETGVKERSAGTQKKIVKAAVAETPVRPEAQFDGEWKGKFVVVIDNEGGDLCGFRGKYFDATVKDNEFVAIINQDTSVRLTIE